MRLVPSLLATARRSLVARIALIPVLAVGCGRLTIADDAPPPHALPDAFVIAADPCLACTEAEICVEEFDGTCGYAGARCVPRTVDCPATQVACSVACEEAYCQQPFQCQYRNGCGASPLAFTCYGP